MTAKASETVRTAIGEMQFMHNVYGEIDDVIILPENAQRPPEGMEFLEWLFVFSTFNVQPVDKEQNPTAMDVMVILRRSIRASDDDIVWVTPTDIDGTTFALGFKPDAFNDEIRKETVLDGFTKEFKRLVNRAKESGMYTQPALAEHSHVGMHSGHS